MLRLLRALLQLADDGAHALQRARVNVGRGAPLLSTTQAPIVTVGLSLAAAALRVGIWDNGLGALTGSQ